MEQPLVTEVPNSLKRLVRMVMRGFYIIDQSILIDMLIRNPCMKEDDLVELLQFERKQLRAVIATLKSDRLVKTRMKLETLPDNKTVRQVYYYINYKVFVNVVKYKLDHMRRKIETEERDSTSRASFKCTSCEKTFTDLEADLLLDITTGDFKCNFCGDPVDEDASALPKTDSRLLLAKFNQQIEPLYVLLREVEDIRLAPELLEPEPTDVSQLKRDASAGKPKAIRGPGDHNNWSGEATRGRNFLAQAEEQGGITVNFNTQGNQQEPLPVARKDGPIWMSQSTVLTAQQVSDFSGLKPSSHHTDSMGNSMLSFQTGATNSQDTPNDNIMQALLAYERKTTQALVPKEVHPSDENTTKPLFSNAFEEEVGEMESGDEDEEEDSFVLVAGEKVPLQAVTQEHTAQMTPSELQAYIKLAQELYSNHCE